MSTARDGTADDPYLWLEDVFGDRALAWVREQNAHCLAELQSLPGFERIRTRLLTILDSEERIPFIEKKGRWFYNFWRDERQPRGVWRRTTMEEYRKEHPAWEPVLDLDLLAAAEGENWVWQGANVLEPSFDRALVFLSRGGTDASVMREFDLEARAFVPGGFALAEAKNWAEWRDRDTLYVGTDFGPGSMTASGYPRIGREWVRGTPLQDARTAFSGRHSDVGVQIRVERHGGHVHELAWRGISFFTNETSLRRGETFVRIDKPDETDVETWGPWILFTPRTDWTVAGRCWKAGSLLAADLEAWMEGVRALTPVFEPGPKTSLKSVSSTRNCLLLNTLDTVRSRPFCARPAEGRWTLEPIPAPGFAVADVHGVDPDGSDDFFLHATDPLTPSRFSLGRVGSPEAELLKSLPAFFRSDGLEIRQFEAVSRDGTRVPYFVVGTRNLRADGSNRTLLNGYGGFQVPMLPSYSAMLGAAWLERGGVYALANIRGGGEFGPGWHNAARKHARQRAYDDFIAVAEDLIRRNITAPRWLGITGRSNGGLLMGVMLTQRPELFRAVACGNPLLDMRQYHRLLAGASWMDEYGDPDDPADWEAIRRYSPYQNAAAAPRYPRVLFTTSTRDDRVHPGHARKMHARLRELGQPSLSYENIEGGHGSASNNRQVAFLEALVYAFLWRELAPEEDNTGA